MEMTMEITKTIDRKNGVFIKRYPYALLVEDRHSVERRCAGIGRFSSPIHLPHSINWTIAYLEIQMPFLKHATRPTAPELRFAKDELVPEIKRAHTCIGVHGDIRLGNFLSQQGKIFLIDWEPALRQYRRGVVQRIAGKRAPADIRNRTLTVQSDWYALETIMRAACSDHYR